MIIYDPRNYGDVLFRLHGSVIPSIFSRMLLIAFSSFFVCWYYDQPNSFIKEEPLPDSAHKLFGFLVGFLLVFRSTIAHKRYTDGIAKLSALENQALEFTRKVCMYASDGSGGWSDEAGAAKLKATRADLRRRTVQYALLAILDMRRDLCDPGGPAPVTESEQGNPLVGGPGLVAEFPLTAYNSQWLAVARRSALFTAEECDGLQASGANFVSLASRNLKHALFPLFKKKHFPHVNMLRECVGHVKALNNIWSDCMAMSTTPIPLPYVQMAKIFTLLFLLTLPIALVEDLGWHTVLATFILSLGYLGLDAIATEMEMPFGTDLNDLPVMETVEKVEKGVRTLLSQLEGEDLEPYEIRPFFEQQTL